MLKFQSGRSSPVFPRDVGNQTFPPERSQLSRVWTPVFIAAFVCDTNVVSVLRLLLARVINDGDAGASHQPAFVFLVGAVTSFSCEAKLPQPVIAC